MNCDALGHLEITPQVKMALSRNAVGGYVCLHLATDFHPHCRRPVALLKPQKERRKSEWGVVRKVSPKICGALPFDCADAPQWPRALDLTVVSYGGAAGGVEAWVPVCCMARRTHSGAEFSLYGLLDVPKMTLPVEVIKLKFSITEYLRASVEEADRRADGMDTGDGWEDEDDDVECTPPSPLSSLPPSPMHSCASSPVSSRPSSPTPAPPPPQPSPPSAPPASNVERRRKNKQASARRATRQQNAHAGRTPYDRVPAARYSQMHREQSEYVCLNEASQRRTEDGEWIDDDDEEKIERLHDARSQRMTVQRRIVRECWEAEDEAVQQEVVAKARAKKAPGTEAEKDVENSERTPEEYQMSLDESIKVAEIFLTEFGRMTGWVGALVYAGPVPRLGGDLGFKSYSFGLAEGVNFEDYHSNWKKAVVTPLCKFARKAIPRAMCVSRAFKGPDNEEDEPASEPMAVVAPPRRPHKSKAKASSQPSKPKTLGKPPKPKTSSKASPSKAKTSSAMSVSPPASRSSSPNPISCGVQKMYQDYENEMHAGAESHEDSGLDYGDPFSSSDMHNPLGDNFPNDFGAEGSFLNNGISSSAFLRSTSSSAFLGENASSSSFLADNGSSSAFLAENTSLSTSSTLFLGEDTSSKAFLSSASSTSSTLFLSEDASSTSSTWSTSPTAGTLSFDAYVNAHPEMLVRQNSQMSTNDNNTFGSSVAGDGSSPHLFLPPDVGGQGLHWTLRGQQRGEGDVLRLTVDNWSTPNLEPDPLREETARGPPRPRPIGGGCRSIDRSTQPFAVELASPCCDFYGGSSSASPSRISFDADRNEAEFHLGAKLPDTGCNRYQLGVDGGASWDTETPSGNDIRRELQACRDTAAKVIRSGEVLPPHRATFAAGLASR
ncbi:hypothetical protein C8F04DRAFT_1192634 [Mycena alexandri]|uniref:Uncharacterized protein n=1 Tax=Mycena alexandri TaxID=1745969 RepID=A0AAD6WTC6_9AGAR|nr:hypothetical protein C8F04DRAFT_1192634 [Mycena alexandri]